jgi:hypothetical protein
MTRALVTTKYSSSGVLGNTDGVAVSSGYVGQLVQAASTTAFVVASPAINTYYDVTGLSITLTPGVWLITAQIGFLGLEITAGTSGATISYLALMSGVSTIEAEAAGGDAGGGVSAYGMNTISVQGVNVLIQKAVSTTTTFKLAIQGKRIAGASTMIANGLNTNGNANTPTSDRISATRIA